MPSTTQMVALGWGNPGRAGSAEETDWKRRQLRRPTAVPAVKTLWVHRGAVVAFNALNIYLQRQGARLGERVDDWGFANRDIRGFVGVKSYHAWGLAEDLDAVEHPLGRRHTTFADNQAEVAEVRAVAKALGLRWGYDYQSRPDPMHFEVVVSRARARWIRSRLTKPTRRSRRLARLCRLDVADFCRRIQQSDPYPR